MSCKYKNICTKYYRGCEYPLQDFSRCVSLLLKVYEDTKAELQEYKNIGLTPEQMLEMDREYTVLAKEVAKLREKRVDR